jgi:hypothetical protein
VKYIKSLADPAILRSSDGNWTLGRFPSMGSCGDGRLLELTCVDVFVFEPDMDRSTACCIRSIDCMAVTMGSPVIILSKLLRAI